MGQSSSHDSLYEENEPKYNLPHKIIRLLGKGGNGLVYTAEAFEANPPLTVVVKKISLSHKRKRAVEQVGLLRKEIGELTKLDHQNIVKYHGWNIETPTEDDADTEMAETSHFQIFMEYCPGGTLQDRARKGLRFFHLRECVRQILEGLQYIHDAGIVHGNLTCSNIFIASKQNFQLKIGGFGRVKHYHQKRTNSHSHSSGFAPPVHQAPGSDVEGVPKDPRIDIWGVGCVLIEMLHEGEISEVFDTSEEILDIMGVSMEQIIQWFMGGELTGSHLAFFAKNRKVTECIRFMQTCLKRDPKVRPSTKDLLQHPFVRDNLDELEIRNEKELLGEFTILSQVNDWMFQAVDPTGEAVILTKKEIQLNNWMDEFLAIATVLAFIEKRNEMPMHPQMSKRFGCWACRDAPTGAFLEKMTIISSWDYNGPFIPLEEAIAEGYGGFRADRVKSYARQIVDMLQPIWTKIRTHPLGTDAIVVDLCSSYLLLNKARDKISMLPLLFPEVIREAAQRDSYISANIWDLGLLVYSMLAGSLIDHRPPGEEPPAIPENWDQDSKDFLHCCFTCFRPQTQKSANWIRQPGNLHLAPDVFTEHTFLTLRDPVPPSPKLADRATPSWSRSESK